MCVIGQDGETRPGTADKALTYEGMTLVVKDVPADIWDNCESDTSTETSPAIPSASPGKPQQPDSWSTFATTPPGTHPRRKTRSSSGRRRMAEA